MPKEKKPRICAVRGCPGDRDLTKTYARLNPLPGEPHLSFFRVPAIISRYNSKYCGRGGTGKLLEKMIELSTTRRNAWFKAIGIANDPGGDKCVKICARHFISGRPAELEDETNLDWVPSLKLVPEENPLGKAKYIIKKLVQKQRNTSFRLKYGLSSDDEREEVKTEKNEPVKSYTDDSSSVILSEAEGIEEVLIREEPDNDFRTTEIKEILIPGQPKNLPTAKRKKGLMQGKLKNESPTKRIKVPEEPKNKSPAKKIKEDLIREEPKNILGDEDINEIFVLGEPKIESGAEEEEAEEEVTILEELKIKSPKEMKKVVQGEPKNKPKLKEPAASVKLPVEKKDSRLDKGEIFLDDEATNSNITNYMLKHSEEQNGHWHLRFCKNENCTLKKKNDSEMTNGAQAQPSEQKGHYHLRLCTCTSCVLSQSVDSTYSLKGT